MEPLKRCAGLCVQACVRRPVCAGLCVQYNALSGTGTVPHTQLSHTSLRGFKSQHRLQLAHNKAALLTLNCTPRTNINNMHESLSWLRVEEKLTTSLLDFFFKKHFVCWKCLTTCIIYLHTLWTDIHTPPDTPLWVSSLYPKQKLI